MEVWVFALIFLGIYIFFVYATFKSWFDCVRHIKAQQASEAFSSFIASVFLGFFATLPLRLFIPFDEFLLLIAAFMAITGFIIILSPSGQLAQVASGVVPYQPPPAPSQTNYVPHTPKTYIPNPKITMLEQRSDNLWGHFQYKHSEEFWKEYEQMLIKVKKLNT